MQANSVSSFLIAGASWDASPQRQGVRKTLKYPSELLGVTRKIHVCRSIDLPSQICRLLLICMSLHFHFTALNMDSGLISS